MFAAPIQKLIDAFTQLPGVGPKTAERFVMYLLKSGRGEVQRLERALEDLLISVRSCELCHNFSDTSPCVICRDPRRDKTVICVVAEPQEIHALEKTRSFTGVYHVLRGLIDPMVDVGPGNLKAAELIARVQGGEAGSGVNGAEKISEIIFAFDPTIEGETTIQYLSKQLAGPNLKITRLATGIPSGGSVEYADEVTLINALKNRQNM